MDHVLTNSTVHAETMIVIALILVGAVVKAIRNLSKRLLKSRLILKTDSLTLSYQTPPISLQQELPQQDQQGVDEDGRSNDDDGRIPPTNQRPQF